MANGDPSLPPGSTPPDATPPPAPTPGITQVIPASARVYVSTQGDAWDMIAMRVYGMKRGNEHLMYRLLEANYALRNISIFPAGIGVIVPEVNIATEIPLVPWKSATIIPTQ